MDDSIVINLPYYIRLSPETEINLARIVEQSLKQLTEFEVKVKVQAAAGKKDIESDEARLLWNGLEFELQKIKLEPNELLVIKTHQTLRPETIERLQGQTRRLIKKRLGIDVCAIVVEEDLVVSKPQRCFHSASCSCSGGMV